MQKTNIGKYEKVLLSVGALLFVSLMSVVMLRPDWITSLITDTSKKTVNEDLNEERTKEVDKEEEKSNIVKMGMDLQEDELEFKINLDKSVQITGIELYLERDGVEISEVNCIGDFNCVKKDLEDPENIRIFLMQSPENANKELQNEVRVVKMNYKGNGTLRIKEESFISSLDQGTIDIESKEYKVIKAN